MLRIEIRAGEGGEDAKGLVIWLFKIYTTYLNKIDIKPKNVKKAPGFITFNVKNISFFNDEAGGHRIQRIPPTEKRGRTHTSTVTVAVLKEGHVTEVKINPNDIHIGYFKAPGSGGQKKNVTSSACRVRHFPTGIIVERSGTRSAYKNKDAALQGLQDKLDERARKKHQGNTRNIRNSQIGSGMRGDKIRTYREQDDVVIDHRTNKKSSLKAIKKGDWSKIKRI